MASKIISNMFSKEWIENEGFTFIEEEDGNLTFSKLVEDSDFWVFLPTYFADVKSQYLILWWKNTSLKIKSEIEFRKFQYFIEVSDCELPRKGPIAIKKTVLGLLDTLNKKYKKEPIELKIIDFHNITFKNLNIDCYKTHSSIKEEKIFVWYLKENYSTDEQIFEWREIINFEKFGFVFKPIDEIQEIKLKLLKYENSGFENLFENSFIGIFSDLEIFNSSQYKYSIGNQEKIGFVIYRTDLAQFQITDNNSNLKYAITAVKFLEKL